MRRILLVSILLLVSFSTINALPPQSSDKEELQKLVSYVTDLEFQAELNRYVYDLYLRYGERKISEEKFLLNLMRLVNDEISQRLRNPNEAKEKYLDDLRGMLSEIDQLKDRLNSANISELDTFVDELEKRIRYTVNIRDVNFKKKKVFEDALQILYVSEEMIRLDTQQNQGELTQRIGNSKSRLLSSFGEVNNDVPADEGPRATIYDLYVEWKRTDEVTLNVRFADVQLARRNLLKSSTPDELLRMFNSQLNVAYTQFNFGDYDLTELLLGDLIETFSGMGFTNLDDVYFYRGESNFALNRLMHAQENYKSLINEYPSTGYIAEVYSRLVQINYTLENPQETVRYAGLYQNVASSEQATYYDVQFLMAMAYYQLGNIDRTVETLANVPDGHAYYHLAQYFTGNAYADGQLMDDAVRSYVQLSTDERTPPYIKARAYYKLGILEYERKNYSEAILYLNAVDPQFTAYDNVLNALAWTHFENERSKSAGEIKDFSQARLYARTLNEEYYSSPYKMEATGLLAYINQLENEPLAAIDLYRDVYQTKVKRGSIDEYLGEREMVESQFREALTLKDKALAANDKATYLKADKLVRELEERKQGLDVAETSGAGLSVYREVNSLITQLRELNSLKLRAREMQNENALIRIDTLEYRLASALREFPPEILEEAQSVNLFDDYPVSKSVAEEAAMHADIMRKREEITGEMAYIDGKLQQIQDRISIAKLERQYDMVTRLEEKHDRLEHIRKRYDRVLVETYAIETQADPYPEFNRWGDLGAFGIINVYFDQKQKMQGRLLQVADVLDRVNKQLDNRKEVIESKIKKIEAEIRFMTMKARREERARLRAERERSFRESYFDTRESETEEENR
ncbi:MAG: tetratricopeptide repeat protein [Calditrichia bacterium]